MSIEQAFLSFCLSPPLLRGALASASLDDDAPKLPAWQNALANLSATPPTPLDLGIALASALGLLAFEEAAGAAFLAAYPLALWAWAVALPAAFAQLVADWRYKVLTDELSLLLLGLGAFSLVSGGWNGDLTAILSHAGSAVLTGAVAWFCAYPYSRWRGRTMLGEGDVKMMPALAVWLPFPILPVWFVAAALLSVLGHLGKRLVLRSKEPTSPFGPALIFAWLACVLADLAGLPSLLGPLASTLSK